MTAAWGSYNPPLVTSWWVRRERVGAASGEYDWAAAPSGTRYPKGTKSANYTWAGSATGQSSVQISDNFDRANANTLGSDWTNRQGTVGISSNEAYAYSTAVACYATHNTSMSRDNMRVSAVTGYVTSYYGWNAAKIFLGSNTTGERVEFLFTEVLTGYSFIQTFTSWADTAPVNRGNYAGTLDFTQGVSQISGERSGNVYTMKFNGDTIATWTDSGNVMPRNSSHRLCGLYVYRYDVTDYRVASFAAQDI